MTQSMIETVARGLSKAQKAYMGEKAEWRSPTGYDHPRWMTFPPASVHRVLIRHGLVDASGQILTRGLEVRAHMETNL